jgi:FixJ family two-component response regulator
VLTAVERALKVHGFDAEVFDTVEAFRAGARLDEASCLVLDINLDGRQIVTVSRGKSRLG